MVGTLEASEELSWVHQHQSEAFTFNIFERIYNIVYTLMEGSVPQVAKVFKSGNSQAVRLPKEFRFSVEEVEVSREGDAIILRPHPESKHGWSSLRSALERGVSNDFMKDGREQPKEQARRELDDLFN